MALRGDLTSVGLADVFQMLALNQKEGILSIHGREQWRALYFDRRGVTLYYNEQIYLDRLLDALHQKGVLAPDTLGAMRRENGGDPISTIESLLGASLLAEESFLDAFRMQMEEDIYDLFLWENVHWEFLEGAGAIEGREGVINENFFLSPDSMIMEAARRLDEWAFIREQVPSPLEIFEPLADVTASEIAKIDEEALTIFELVDGKRNVARIIDASGITPFHVYKSLSILSQEQFIRPLPDDLLLEHANDCIEEGRIDDGILLLEKAIEAGAGLPDAHLLAAKTYVTLDEAARANWHYKTYAAYRTEEGNFEEAAEVLEVSSQLIPTDLEARERFIQVLLELDHPPQDPVELGKRLINLYLDLDDTDRARAVLEHLLVGRPDDLELKKTLVAVHTKAGDTKRVMDLYESIASDLVDAKDPIGAVRYLQKILMIDRNRKDISDRIKQLYMLDERHRSRKRSLALAVAGMLCFGALGTVYFLYERNVRQRFATLDATPFLEAGNYDGAIEMYETFLASHPLSLVGSQVETQIKKIRAAKSLVLEQQEQERRSLAILAKQKRQEYKRLWREYQDSFEREQNLEKALGLLEKVAVLIDEAGEPQDKAFRSKMKIDKALDTQRNYLAEASRLAQAVRDRLEAGEIGKARTLALRMHENFGFANATRKTLVPFRIHSIPTGAEIWVGNKPVRDAAGDALVTPANLRIPYLAKTTILLRKDGYRERKLEIRGKDSDPVSTTLAVEPERVITLKANTVTGIAAKDRYAVAGLTEGRILCFDFKTGKTKFVHKLGGLDELQQRPAIVGNHAIFATVQGLLVAVRISDGELAWSVKLRGAARTSLLPMAGGVVLGLASGDLAYFEETKGNLVWNVRVGGQRMSDPVVFQDRIWVANSAGHLVGVATDDGEVLRDLDLSEPISGPPVLLPDGSVVFYTPDGKVRAFDRKSGKEQWAAEIGKPGGYGSLIDVDGELFAVTAKGLVRHLEGSTGSILHEYQLEGRLAGRAIGGSGTLNLLCLGKQGMLLTSLSSPALEFRWNYLVEGELGAPPTRIGSRLVVGIGKGLHLLR